MAVDNSIKKSFFIPQVVQKGSSNTSLRLKEAQKLLLEFESTHSPQKIKKMGRSWCPICGLKNTFIIDCLGSFEIRLCISCAKKENFEIKLNNIAKCISCGEFFIKRKSETCPVCWIKFFKGKNGIN